MRTHDVSAQLKTGEALLKLVIEDIKWSEEMYGLTIIAACSDDGGDAHKMRRVLLALMPWLIITLCWAHCYVTAGTFARRGLSSTAKTLRSLSGVRGSEY